MVRHILTIVTGKPVAAKVTTPDASGFGDSPDHPFLLRGLIREKKDCTIPYIVSTRIQTCMQRMYRSDL
jgi:hypothetical protein